MARVTLYTRKGCHLCEDVRRVLESARRHTDFELEAIDIDQDPELRRLYNDEVPVVSIEGRKAFKYRLDEKEFLRKLGART